MTCAVHVRRMAARRKSTDKGISYDAQGRPRAQIRIHGRLHRKRFPTTTTTFVIRQWLMAREVKYRGTKATKTGKFDDDARAYLSTCAAMPTFTQRSQHIEEWIAVFKDRPRDGIAADDIAAQLALWRTTPRTVTYTRRKTDKTPRTARITLSAGAVNKRRSALMHLFTTLDGKSAPNPVKDVPKFREPDALPRGLEYSAIRALFATMTDSPSKARLMVLAYTGIPHKQLEQLTVADVDLERGTVRAAGRRKGKGTGPRVMPLTKDGVRAMKAMARTDAWGAFSRSTLRKLFQAACAAVPALKARAATLTPYDLRHSFGTEVYRASGDIRATQVLMGHSSPTLTHRYTLGAVEGRITAALKGFGRKRKT